MNPQDEIQQLRAKYGIPPEGVAKPAVAPASSQDRLAKFEAGLAAAKPKSTYQKIADTEENLGEGIVKGVGSTLTGAGTLASKALSHLPGKVGDFFQGGVEEGKHLEDTVLKTEGTAQKVGKGIEQIGEFFIPSGAINEAEKALTTGTNIIEKLTPHIGETAAKLVDHAAKTGVKMGIRAGEGGGIIAVQSGGDAEQTKKAAETGGIFSGVTSGVLSPALSKILAPFKDSHSDTIGRMFESEGIKAPVSALSKNQGVRMLEAGASKTLFGKGISQIAEDASNQLEQKINQTIDSLAPTKSMSEESLGSMLQTGAGDFQKNLSSHVENIKPNKTMSVEELGKNLQKGLNEFETHFKATEDKVYEAFSKKYGMAPARPLNTQSELASIIAQKGESVYGSIDPKLKNMFSKITQEDPEITTAIKEMRSQNLPEETIRKEIEKMTAGKEPFEMTFNQLKATRTDVGEALARDPDNTALKRLYGALSRDMQDTVSFDKEGATALAKINAKYKAGKDKIEGRIAQSMIQSNPERIVENLVTRNSADAISSLKEMVGPENFAEVQKSFMRKILSSAETEGGYDPKKIKEALGEYDQETLNQILTPDQQKNIKSVTSKLEENSTNAEIASSLKNDHPEKIAQNLVKKNSAEYLTNVKKVVGEEKFKEVSKYFLRDIVEKGKTEGGKLKVEKLKTAIDRLDQSTLNVLLSPQEQKGLKEGIDRLEKLQTMTEATKAGSKAAQGSQTAFLANAQLSAGALSAGIINALTTGNFLILSALGAKTGGEYALAKFIASDAGRKILTEGINSENIKLLQDLKPALRSIIIESVSKENDQ